MSRERRISDFWLDGGKLTRAEWFYRSTPRTSPPRKHWFYAVEYGESGPVVHRFRYVGALAIWLASAERGMRERIKATDPRVESAKARDEWGEHESEHE